MFPSIFQSGINNPLIEEVSLSDEKDLILEHLLLLDEDSRSNRFCGNVSDSYIESFVDSLSKQRGDRLYGIFQRDIEPTFYELFPNLDYISTQIFVPQIKSSIIGLSHISMFDHNGINSGELALSVLSNFQKRGLGSMLVEDAILHRARELGIDEISCQCLYTNRKVQELFKREGSEIDLDLSSNSSSGRVKIPSRDLEYLTRKVVSMPVEMISMIGSRTFR